MKLKPSTIAIIVGIIIVVLAGIAIANPSLVRPEDYPTPTTTVSSPTATTQPTAVPPTPTPAPKQPKIVHHQSDPNCQGGTTTVGLGETLQSIAASIGVSNNELAKCNGLVANSLVHNGDQLVLPTKAIP